MTALAQLLETFRKAAQSEREKGTYFEELVKAYLLNEPFYKDLLGGKVYLWEEWRALRMRDHHEDLGADAGIDLVAVEDVTDNPRIFAIQAKFYAEDANNWAIETMGNPKYPLELFQRVVNVSLETQKIVSALPKLDI